MEHRLEFRLFCYEVGTLMNINFPDDEKDFFELVNKFYYVFNSDCFLELFVTQNPENVCWEYTQIRVIDFGLYGKLEEMRAKTK